MFGIILSIGVVGMFVCMVARRKVYSISIFKCAVLTLLLTAVGVAGAKLLYALENGLQAWDGVSFFGSVYLIPAIMPLLGLPFGMRPKRVLDLCAPCVAIMIACMRINCFISGCCGGWQVCIASFCFAWPTQALDSLGDVLIMWWMLKKEGAPAFEGSLYPWFMILYSVMRFFLEFLRDTPKDWLLLSHGQWFCLAALLIGGLWLGLLKRRASAK